MTLQQHFNLIKEGKGNKDQFLKQARQLFPNYLTKYLDFDTSVSVLKSKQIISEAAGGVVSKGFNVYDWKKILGEEIKATEKETSKQVLDTQAHNYDNKDMKNADNINFNEIMKGFYAELRDEKNNGKTGDEIKAMVVKNLSKDPLYYTKDGMFGEKGVGYTDEAPGLGKNTQPTSKKATVLGGNNEVDSDSDVVKNSLVGSAKKNVQDSLGNSEAKDSMPKKVKEMPDKGVTGVEKKVRLKEGQILAETEINEDGQINKNYTYFAVNKKTNKIANGWETISDVESLKYYAKMDLEDMDLNPSDYKILSKGYLIKNGIDPFDIKNWEGMNEGLYQGPSIKIGAGGNLGGRRFIPNVTVLKKDAIDSINAKGLKRINWEKPHIKALKSGEGFKLLISKLLVDTIVGSERGRSKLSLAVSKMGTGITPEEMGELSGEFKKLVKVLNANGKLVQNGDYYLLDVPTEYNAGKDQFEMPLPKALEENIIRSLIQQIIKEELNEYGMDSGGQDMTWGMYKEKSQSKDGSNQDFINKGKYDFYDDVPFEACPYEDGFNKYYKADLAKLWQMGWKEAEAEAKEELNEELDLGQQMAAYYGTKEYIDPTSVKYNEDEEGGWNVEFIMNIPKEDVMEMDLPEAEEYFSKEYKTNYYQGPGAQYSKTYVDVRDGGNNWIVDIYANGGYDI